MGMGADWTERVRARTERTRRRLKEGIVDVLA